MKRGFGGRVLLSLPFLFSLLSSCREDIPSAPAPATVDLHFSLPLHSYYTYDNWILSPEGIRIPESMYRTAWRVVDTGIVAMGTPGVTDVMDSTFMPGTSGRDSLVAVRHLYFRTVPNGDVFEYGFIAGLLFQRDSVAVDSQWDRLLSPAAGLNNFWSVETGDSATVGTVQASFFPQLETVEDSINGVAMGVLAYHVEITASDVTLDFWVGGSPPAFLRVWDMSDVPYNRLYQELRSRRTD